MSHSILLRDDARSMSSSSEEEDDESSRDRHSSMNYDDLDLDHAFLYFVRLHGRLFHPHGISLYPLPVDAEEQQRQIALHVVHRQTIGANYVGPVPYVLNRSPGRPKRVLDLGTGSGQWPMEMALEFPDVQFVGLDIGPVAPLCSLPNVQYMMQDINQPCTGLTDNSFDVVHARDIWLATTDYRGLAREMARILRPGGLFLSCESGFYAALHPDMGRITPEHARGAHRFYDIATQCMRHSGIESPAQSIPNLLRESGQFCQVEASLYYVPIGPWHGDPRFSRTGRAFRAVLVREAEAWKPKFRESGLSAEEVEEICADYVRDLRTVRFMVAVYHAVWARKRF